jgi:hypothetical protein
MAGASAAGETKGSGKDCQLAVFSGRLSSMEAEIDDKCRLILVRC